MRKIIIVILILASLVFLAYGYIFSQYNVITVPASDADNKPAQVAIMNEAQLLDEMCYDGISRDKDGNLIKKQREKACVT